MEITKKQKSEIIFRKKILIDAKIILKSEFVGLDPIIDEIVDIVQPWYIFPKGQLRPAIIGLWGLTGVGKTSIVRRLAELINMEKKLFKFDVGDYCSGDLKLRYDMSSKLKNHEKQPVILVFDEFQLGRTITEHGNEQDRNGLRAVWDILDSGKFHIINDNYYSEKLMSIIIKLDECMRSGVEANNGVITKNRNIHNGIFYPDGRRKNKKAKRRRDEEDVDKEIFVPEEHHYSIYTLCEKKFINEDAVSAHLFTLDEKQTMEFLHSVLDDSIEPIEHDFSQALIFIIGNVDEAYMMSDNVDPDVDADIFYEHSLKITVPHIKNALLKRFRAEQIARFGNNFVIYPAFNSDSYKKLIELELIKVKKRVIKNFGVELDFDGTLNDIIYKESVFPTQGTRPIFTTVSCMVESYVCQILSFMAEKMSDCKRVHWSYFDDNYRIKFYEGSQTNNPRFVEIYPVKLKVENLRRSSLDEEQANTAIHEAGHAVLSSLILGLIPEEIVSKTAGMSRGFCRTEFPEFRTKTLVEHDIIVSLGGHIAEQLVFGDDHMTTGSISDIENATHLAIEYVRSYGMSGMPIKVSAPDVSMNSNASFAYEDSDKQAKKLIMSSRKIAAKCLKDNMILLLKLGEYLSEKPRMTKQQIQDFVIKYNDYGIKEFKTKDNYHGFKKELAKKLVGANIVQNLKESVNKKKK